MTLNALTLSANSVPENSPNGTFIGTLVGRTAGSTLSLIDNAGGRFALNGLNIEVAGALDYESATSHEIIVQEAKTGAINTPKQTVLTILLTDVAEGGGLAQPTIVRTSAAGTNPPTWDINTAPDLQDGDTIELYFSTDGSTPSVLKETHIAQAEEETINWATFTGFAGGANVKWSIRYGRLISGSWVWSPMSNVLSDTMSAAAWSPASYFTGAIDGAYYDVSDISTLFKDTAGTVPVTADGDLVARINDKSGNGYHLTQATSGNRPTYKTNGGVGGNKPYLDFQGNQYLTCTAFAAKAQPHYVAVAGKFDSVAANMQFCDGQASGNRMALGGLSSSGGVAFLSGGTGVASALATSVNDVVEAGLFNGASSLCYIDGVASAALSGGTHTLTGLTVGMAYNTTTGLDGRIYAFAWVPANPSGTDKGNFTTWAGSKQGRTL